jgi:hypothetical protein
MLADLMRAVVKAENNAALRPALKKRWPKVEPFIVPSSDPRDGLRGQRGLKATQPIKKGAIICPYQVPKGFMPSSWNCGTHMPVARARSCLSPS